MAKSSAVLGKIVLLVASLCIQLSFIRAQSNNAVAQGGPDRELKDFRFDELETRLPTMEQGLEHDYLAGVLANRVGRVEESILLLNRALPTLRTSRPDRAAVALEALADDDNKSFRYADAAQAYDELLTHFVSQLDNQQLQGAKDDSGVTHLLRGAPAQTITWDGPTRLRTERNPLGSINVELTVNGVRDQWLLDTGANLSVVTRSFARRLGLKFLPGTAQTSSGITGIENRLRVALLPTLRLGGATLHNVVVMVFDDASLKVEFGKEEYQIQGIIGYPVFQALGAITFLQSGWFEAGNKGPSRPAGAKMYMNQLTPVVECVVGGETFPFSLDTGASGTDLSVRYYNRFRSAAKEWKKGKNKSFGAGGVVERTIYLQPHLSLGVGDKTVSLDRVSVFPSPMGAGIDDLYGNLGQDVVARFASFTLDFSTMTFSLGEPLPLHETH